MNKRRLLILLVLAILWASPTTQAANWYFVSDYTIYTDTKTNNYMDLDSIIDSSIRSKDVWLRIEYDPPMYTSYSASKISYHLLHQRYTIDNTTCRLRTIIHFTDGTREELSPGECKLKLIGDSLVTPDKMIWDKLFQ